MLLPTLLAASLTGAPALHAEHATGAIDPAESVTGILSHRPETITGFVHLLYRPDTERVPAEGNVEVIEQKDGLVVVDAGGALVAGQDLVAKIRELSPLPVKFLIYTHWHGDHNLGSPAFKSAYPHVRIVSTEATRLHLTDGSQHVKDFVPFNQTNADNFAAMLKKGGLDPELSARLTQIVEDTPAIVKAVDRANPVIPDLTFADHLTIEDAAAPVQVMFPGKANTDGDAVIWLPKQKILITGDVVVAPVPYGSESYPREWSEALSRLDKFDFAYLIPGHGAVQRDHVYLKRVNALLTDMIRQIGPLARQGLSLDEVQKRVNFKREIASFGGTGSWRQTEFDGYFLQSMIKNVYLEARGEPIVQGQPFR